ncbi:hypothetical protein C8F04DRAFT_1393462 [Mycena alexandri]|uniref:AB hydrolase-1 domain-containing protein n=1 Tax=Mycena alexandri TaxID=1745969 RepID=A0AAD6X3N1_9AGAR|nr:hypothetical protein C8F04DRAFT_1393462 [Mycena alexandri]
MSPTKPEIIIIPGAFCPLKYSVADLKAHGYSVHGVELETVGRRDAPPDEGKDVVLVPHAYGGVPACESAKGLAKSVRQKEGKGGYLFMTDLAKAAALNLSDLSPEEGLVWANKWTQHSAASFGQPLTYAAYKDIPASWVFIEQDKSILPDLANKMIGNMEAVMGGRKVERFPVGDVGHCINMSQPATFAKVVRKALGNTV